MDNSTKMTDFNINELMLFIVGVLGAIGGLCVVLQRSKCETCCWGLIKRNVDAVIQNERLNRTGHTGITPQRRRASITLEERGDFLGPGDRPASI